jgi:acylphosphatase
MEQTANHIIFSGRVQGIGFRFTVNTIARRYDVCGYVKNLPNGTVEMFVQGPPHEVDRCLADIQDSFAGYIRDTKIEQASCSSRYTEFGIAF